MTNFNERTNERTNTLLYKNIPLTFYSRKGLCWLCVRGELETGTDCYILTQSSSHHSSTSSSVWLSCSTVGHWGPKPSIWSWFSLRWHPISHWLQLQLKLLTGTDWPKPSVAPGYIIVWHPPASCGRTHPPPSPNSTTSTGQGNIPISSTGCTCFAYLHRCISWLTARSRVNMLHSPTNFLCSFHLAFFSRVSLESMRCNYSVVPTRLPTRKNSRFILSKRSDFFMVNNPSIAVHAILMHV